MAGRFNNNNFRTMAIGDVDRDRQMYRIASKEDLERALRCPVCFDLPLPPVFQCKTGHIICENCRFKVRRCALCSEYFTYVRNFVQESIIDASLFRCDFWVSGCDKIIIGRNLDKHLQECEFRPIRCQLDVCRNTFIKYSAFMKHLEEVHKSSVCKWIEDNRFSRVHRIEFRTTANFIWYDGYMKFDGKTFLCYTLRSGKSNTHFCLAILGTESDALGYTVKITFSKLVDSRVEVLVPMLEMTIPVISMRRNFGEILNLPTVTMTESSLRNVGQFNRSYGKIELHTTYTIQKKM